MLSSHEREYIVSCFGKMIHKLDWLLNTILFKPDELPMHIRLIKNQRAEQIRILREQVIVMKREVKTEEYEHKLWTLAELADTLVRYQAQFLRFACI